MSIMVFGADVAVWADNAVEAAGRTESSRLPSELPAPSVLFAD